MTAALRPVCVNALREVTGAGSSDAAGGDTPELRAARHHLEICPICASLIDDPAAADKALATIATTRGPRSPVLRSALGIVAGVQCLFALPWLFGFSPFDRLGNHVAPSHLTRDGALGVILGVAGMTSAFRPRHALAMLVTAGAGIAMQGLSYLFDQNTSRVGPRFELVHLLVPIIVAMIAVLVYRRPAPIDPPQRPPHLRVLP
jgi:hypothetical protein